jgi:glycosyltransferase involved in cell wall biosynthesis
VKIAYLFGGRFDPVALGGNAVDIREDLQGLRGLGQEVTFRSYETAPLDVPPAVRTSKRRLPPALWDTVRDTALLRKDRRFRQQLFDDAGLAGVQLVFEYWSPSSFGGSAFAQAHRLPHVLENIDPITDELRDASAGLLAPRLRALEGARRRNATAIIVMARGMGDYLVREWGVAAEHVHWLPQGVNTELFHPVDPAETLRLRNELGGGARLVGFVGSLASYQRVDVLVDAARRLREQRSDVKLVLVGGSVERARALGAEDVGIVIPHVAYEQVPSYISAFDVAVLPDSNWYGSPIKVLEYAAVGAPVIAPDISAVRDLVSGPHEALLVPPSDPEALANAIAATLDSPEAAAERARRFGARVRSQFDRADRTKRVLDLCEQLVAEESHG